MNIIDQLEQIVTPAVLGSQINNEHVIDGHSIDNGSVSYVSLLEQFYAILAARLALPQIYSQLLRDDEPIDNENIVEAPLFEQLWQAPSARQTIIEELALTHHIDKLTTTKLIMNAAPLAYRELKVMANGQFLPAFLQNEQPSLRHYLPIWAAPLITVAQDNPDELFDYQNAIVNAATETVLLNKDATEAGVVSPSANLIKQPNVATELASESFDNSLAASAIYANPAEHHLAENSSLKREKVRTRNQRNDLLIRVFLLLAAIAAIGLVWVFLIKPNDVPPVEPVATAPAVITPVAEPPAQVLTPATLIVGVDNNGSLYTCSASVGDAALQNILQQALNSSFGEQAGMCQFTVQEGVANNIANMPIEALPNILTLLRATPFARLQLQNDRMTIEAPDSMQLQKLTNDIRTLAPAIVVDSTAPLPLPNNAESGIGTDNMAMNGASNQFAQDGSSINDQYTGTNNMNNSNANNNNDYQASDDVTGDSVTPAPVRNNDFNNPSRANEPRSNEPRINEPRSNDRPASTRPPGPFSESEVDDMANSVIVAEPAQVR